MVVLANRSGGDREEKGWKTGVGAGFFVTLASDFPLFRP
jgi:hypothetical protein